MNSEIYTLQHLSQTTLDELDDLTRNAAGALGVSRLWMGRCLVALSRENRAGQLGYSGAMHFAKLLGVDLREAREARRVARSLEELPQLKAEAECGTIAWTSLREMVRKATLETEAHWLKLSEELTPTQIARLVARTKVGEFPEESTLEGQEPVQTETRIVWEAFELRIIQEAMRRMSEREGRPISMKEAFLGLAVGRIAGTFEPEERVVSKIHSDAELDVAAMEAPWATVGSEEVDAPSDPHVSLVQPAKIPHWQNPRVEFHQQSRHTTPAQRLEILRRDGYRCATPECPNHLWLQVHHIVFYCRGGATVPANLTACCSACHRNIHERYLYVRGCAPGGLSWTTAAGLSLGTVGPSSSGGIAFGKAD